MLAVIESINEQALFVEMDRENRQRADLRPYEQGEIYRRALDEGLYMSLRKLAEAIGVQASNVSVAVKIARLPADILDAFPSRLDVQYRWAAPWANAMETEPDVILKRARAIIARKEAVPLSAADVYRALIGSTKDRMVKSSQDFNISENSAVVMKKSGKKVLFEIDNPSKEKVEQIHKAILQALAG